MASKGRKLWGRFVLEYVCVFFVFINIFILAFSLFMNTKLYINAFIPQTPPDETPPVITMNGPEVLRIALGSEYKDLGINAFDVRGETTVAIEGEVDTNTEGEYTITYTATDEHENQSTATRTVKVIKTAGTIYLTFDDGPGPYTEKLLNVLKKYHVLATFFVTGSGSDDLIKREYTDGHAIGLHSFSHNYSYIYSSTDNFWADMNRVQERVKNITGKETKLMRFPGGSSNTISARYDRRTHIMSKLVNEATEKGFTFFDWNVLSGDAGETTDTSKVYENVTTQLVHDGDSVVLQHDIKEFSVNAVEDIINYGLEHNYIFDKLDENSFTAHHGVNN